DVGGVGAGPEPVDVGEVGGAGGEIGGELLLPGDGATGDDEVHLGPARLCELERVEEHLEALPGVEAADRADEWGVVRDPDPGPKPTGQPGTELVGIHGGVHDHDVFRVELV